MSFRDISFAGLLCLILAPCLWGGNFVVGSLLASDLPGIWMNLLRWILALVLLVPFCGAAAWAHRETLALHWRRLLVLGGLGVTGFNSVLYVALEHATLPMAAIAFAVTPFLIIGISAVLDGVWPRARVILASCIALGGMILAQAEALKGDIAPLGVGLVLLAALIWAAYSVALQRLALPVPAEASFLGQVIVGTLLLVPLAQFAAPSLPAAPFTPEIWLSLGYLGLCAGALAFWLWQHAIRQAGAMRGSLFMNLVPLSSMVLGAWLLDETLSQVELVAVAIVLFGIGLSVVRGHAVPQPVPAE